tara:strand:- start:222787 stop:225147 length:2361 start_codon:yes stop_codon:yes gene_type:complete
VAGPPQETLADPVPADALRSDSGDTSPFVAGFDRFARHGEIDSVMAGNLLVTELSCTACHASKKQAFAPKRGPNLHDAAVRMKPAWIAEFLTSPHKTKPGTTMPDVLAGKSDQERDQIVRELTAFLMTQQRPLPTLRATGRNPVPFEFWKKGDRENGKQIYHRVGCVACHAPDQNVTVNTPSDSQLDRLLEELDPEELADMGLAGAARRVRSVPHPELPAKYSRRSLTYFLADPLKTRPAGRMPHLKLTAIEAADIAAYLQPDVNDLDEPATGIDPDLISRGQARFNSLGCANCHDATGAESTMSAKAFAALDVRGNSCLDGHNVNYALDDQQVDAIGDVLASGEKQSKADDARALTFTMLQLNCFACHSRDELGGIGRYRKGFFHTVDDIDLGDEGRLPPPLAHVGQKLNKAHMKNVLLGKKADIRPHMHIRMPVFPGDATAFLPNQFAAADQADTSSAAKLFGDSLDQHDVGRSLMDVGCIQCHAFRGYTMPGVVGVDLQGIDARVNPSWFRSFLLDPGSLKARTRMPTFFPDGKSQHPKLLDGDPIRQIGAMWAYLADLDEQPLPEKIEQARSKNYELTPTDQPILLRTFVEDVGTHAIAVGFPEQIHYAFDTQTGILATGWRGRFLDAQGTWYIRFSPEAIPLGTGKMRLPRMNILGASGAKYRFGGYRLDAMRIPTFRYTIDGYDITDRIVPESGQGLRRTIHVRRRSDSQMPSVVQLHLIDGVSLEKKSKSSYANDQGLTVAIIGDSIETSNVEKHEKRERWSVKIDTEKDPSIEVLYTW